MVASMKQCGLIIQIDTVKCVKIFPLCKKDELLLCSLCLTAQQINAGRQFKDLMHSQNLWPSLPELPHTSYRKMPFW